MDEEICVLCSDNLGDELDCATLTPKRIAGIIKASNLRGDKVHTFFDPVPDKPVKVHVQCRRIYINSNKIKHDLRAKTSSLLAPKSHVLRSDVSFFNFRENCVLCAMPISDSEKRTKSSIHRVQTFQFREKIMSACETRNDLWSANVQARLLSVIDLPAAGAQYHQICSLNFRKGDAIPMQHSDPETSASSSRSTGRPTDNIRYEAFVKLCEWFQENDNESVSAIELVEMMRTRLPAGVEPYTVTYLQQKLQDFFGDSIIISSRDGKPNLITFGKTASNIILDHHKHKQLDDTEAEKFRIIETAAKLIKTDIQLLRKSMNFYPSASQIGSTEDNSTFLPPTLQRLLDIIISAKSASLKSVSIGQAILQASRPRSIIAPILLGLGIQLHRDFSSRLLIDQVYKLGFSVSYDEVQRYMQSAAMCDASNTLVPAGHFAQWIADNVDHNIATIDGHNTFHGMGIIMCTSGLSKSASNLLTQKIGRLTCHIPSLEIASKARVELRFFQFPNTRSSAMRKVTFERLTYDSIQINLIDVLWTTSKLLPEPRPGWLGYMQNVIVGQEHPGTCVTFFLPMIDLNPTSHSCVYSTLTFICKEADRLNVEVPVVTFDQCLWIKAMEVVCAKPVEFPKLIIRLGGFHTLMSYLGAIGVLMSGSSIEETLQTVYAGNTIPHILSGKAYSRSLRSHLLVSSALQTILMADVLNYSLPIDGNFSDPSNHQHDPSDSINMTISEVETPSEADESMDVSSDNVHVHRLIELYDSFLKGETTIDSVTSSVDLLLLSTRLSEKKNLLNKESRTSKLWLMYLNMFAIAKEFIWAERTGNFQRHLQAVEHMLPFFASSGHNNYAKCARVYLQQMKHLNDQYPRVYQKFQEGHFTLRRHDKLWAGIWTDMFIEQSLMRSTKSRGGITHGGGMTDSQRALWILSHPACGEITYAICTLTGVTRIGSEQHIDISDARMGRDLEDMNKILQFLIAHNPFRPESPGLRNISSGLTDSEGKVNVDDAETIGRKTHDKLTGKSFSSVTMSKSEQAVTMRILKKSVVIDGETDHVDTRLMTQRMLVGLVLNTDLQELPNNFSYELSTIPPALFDPITHSMRKADKSTLAKALDAMANINTPSKPEDSSYVIDGGALLQILPWPKMGTFADVLDRYDNYVKQHYGFATIVFDGYLTCSTKDVEHQRRAKQSSVIVEFEETSPLLISKVVFLSNDANKQRFVNMLGRHLQNRGHNIIYAPADADTLIVKTALDLSETKHITVIADDTDILILLIHHAKKDICMQSAIYSEKVRDIKAMQISLGTECCKVLIFVHALTGCDTTSALFGKSKSAAIRILCASKTLLTYASQFGLHEGVTVEEMISAGYKILVSLYGGNPNTRSLDMLRYEHYMKKITAAKSEFDIARLPPTEGSAKYHLMRVHFRCLLWNDLNTIDHDPTLWGWKKVSEQLQPITTDMMPAPAKLLETIRCTCKTDLDEPCGTRCSCRRYGLECTVVCKNCSGTECTTTLRIIESDTDDD